MSARQRVAYYQGREQKCDGNSPSTQNDNRSAEATNIMPPPPDRVQTNQATNSSHLHSERQLDNMSQMSSASSQFERSQFQERRLQGGVLS